MPLRYLRSTSRDPEERFADSERKVARHTAVLGGNDSCRRKTGMQIASAHNTTSSRSSPAYFNASSKLLVIEALFSSTTTSPRSIFSPQQYDSAV